MLVTLLAGWALAASSTVTSVLMVGDSMAATDLGLQIERQLAEFPEISFRRIAKSGTGLARREYFDWLEELPKAISKTKPEVVVIAMGGNDGQALTYPRSVPRAERIPAHFGESSWVSEYSKRVRAFLSEAQSSNRRVIWLEIPRREPQQLEERAEFIRKLTREIVESHNAQFLETHEIFDEIASRFPGNRVEAPGFRGVHALRQRDGIHFSAPGAALVASRIVPRMLELLGVSSIRARFVPGDGRDRLH